MTNTTIVLTGATGNLGAVILDHILTTTTYTAHIIIRKESSIPLIEKKYPDAVSSSRLLFTAVPDLTIPGVFDTPASTATYIIHAATPLTNEGFVKGMIEPTWAIDRNILEAARKSGSVKRVVICGTLLQAVDANHLLNPAVTITHETYNPVTFDDAKDGPWRNAYMFSKTNAERKTWEWLQQQQEGTGGDVGFDIVMLLPPLITGRSPQVGFVPDVGGAGGIPRVWSALMVGKKAEHLDTMFPYFLDTDDVARVHIQALDMTKVAGNQRYLLSSHEILNLRVIAARLRREHPELRDRLPDLPENEGGWTRDKLVKVDTGKSDVVFGTEWKGAYESVKEIVFDAVRWEKENGRPASA